MPQAIAEERLARRVKTVCEFVFATTKVELSASCCGGKLCGPLPLRKLLYQLDISVSGLSSAAKALVFMVEPVSSFSADRWGCRLFYDAGALSSPMVVFGAKADVSR